MLKTLSHSVCPRGGGQGICKAVPIIPLAAHNTRDMSVWKGTHYSPRCLLSIYLTTPCVTRPTPLYLHTPSYCEWTGNLSTVKAASGFCSIVLGVDYLCGITAYNSSTHGSMNMRFVLTNNSSFYRFFIPTIHSLSLQHLLVQGGHLLILLSLPRSSPSKE